MQENKRQLKRCPRLQPPRSHRVINHLQKWIFKQSFKCLCVSIKPSHITLISYLIAQFSSAHSQAECVFLFQSSRFKLAENKDTSL